MQQPTWSQTPSCLNQDGKVFENDETLIAKNSTLIIVRKPLPKKEQKVWEEEEKMAALPSSAHSAGSGGPGFMGGLGGGGNEEDLSEADKISNMVANSGEMYDPKHYIKYGRKQMAGGGPPPAHYREEELSRFVGSSLFSDFFPFRTCIPYLFNQI